MIQQNAMRSDYFGKLACMYVHAHLISMTEKITYHVIVIYFI